MGISPCTLQSRLQAWQQGDLNFVGRRGERAMRGAPQMQMETAAAIRWACENMAEHAPDKVGVYVFPMASRRLLYYSLCVMDSKQSFFTKVPSERTFLRVLQTFKGQIQFFQHCRFSKCDDCVALNTLKRKLPANMKGSLQDVHVAHAVHNIWQMCEVCSQNSERILEFQLFKFPQRRKYYDIRNAAVTDSKEWTCLVMDGADQEVSKIPSLRVGLDRFEQIWIFLICLSFTEQHEGSGENQRAVSICQNRVF
jgi:hypothetical protein